MSKARLRRRLIALRRADSRQEFLMAGRVDLMRVDVRNDAPFGWRRFGDRWTSMPLISRALIRLAQRVPHGQQWWPR